jgi:hypothetical protein
MDFQIVHVGPIGMDVGADGMSGPVNKIIAVTFFLDVAAGGTIHFPSCNAASGAIASVTVFTPASRASRTISKTSQMRPEGARRQSPST